MHQDFFFIDGIQADKTSKRLMRRHVMKGKNAGRTLHRPSRTKQRVSRSQAQFVSTLATCDTANEHEQHDNALDWLLPLSPAFMVSKRLGNGLSLGVPIQVTRESLEVINECKHGHTWAASRKVDLTYEFSVFVFTSHRLYSPQLEMYGNPLADRLLSSEIYIDHSTRQF